MPSDRPGQTFLGSKRRILATVLGLVVLIGVVGVVTGILGVPSVLAVENSFGGVNETTTTIETDLRIHNPNPIDIRLGGMTVDYTVEMNGITMATGTKVGLNIPTGNSTLQFTTYLHNGRIPEWWVSHIENGEHTTLTITPRIHPSFLDITISPSTIERDINTHITSAFNTTETRPIEANMALVSDPVLYLNATSGHWGTVTQSKTTIDLYLTVYNPKSYPITSSAIGYEIVMNDILMGSGSTEHAVVIPPGETRTIHVRTTIHNQKLDEWWVTHIKRNQVTTLSIQLYAYLDLPVTGSIRIPVDTLTHTIETDLFGTKGGEGDADSTEPRSKEVPRSTETDTSSSTASERGRSPESGANGPPTGTPSPLGIPTGTPTVHETTTTTPTERSTESTPTDDGLLPLV